jgi:hypothetical protein
VRAPVVSIAALVLGSGCAGPPQAPPAPTARLVRIEFNVGGYSQFVDVDQPITEPIPASGGAVESNSCLRAYSIHATRPEARDLVLCDPCGDGAGDSLLERCRSLALSALRASMSPPRAPLEWHHVALAGFLDLEPLVVTAAERAALMARLARSDEPGPLAEALVANARRFEPAELAQFIGHERLAPSLVALVRAAWGGDRGALTEVFRLSLEYHGQQRLFETAARALFPAAANASLWRKYPPGGGETPAVFLADVQSRLHLARALGPPGGGWSLEGTP